MIPHEKISYVEFPSTDLNKTKAFYQQVFGWDFQDYGPEYSAIHNAGIDGGFYQSDSAASTSNGSVLIVIYSQALEQTQAKVEANGGTIVKPVFSFPGGRRSHFSDPTGNELAVWSDKAPA